MNAVNEIRLDDLTPEGVTPALEKIIQENTLLLFMKGNRMFPQCGFSAQVVEIFKRLGASFTTFNVLENDLVREGVKSYSNWPTLPQVYYKGKFLGGCDIVTEMYQNGELEELLAAA